MCIKHGIPKNQGSRIIHCLRLLLKEGSNIITWQGSPMNQEGLENQRLRLLGKKGSVRSVK